MVKNIDLFWGQLLRKETLFSEKLYWNHSHAILF